MNDAIALLTLEMTCIGEAEQMALGAQIGACLAYRGLLYLSGELGAGKTTLMRGLLQGIGHQGAVKSPTYSLIESYSYDNHHLYHSDLYRLNDPEELELIGLRELFQPTNLLVIEWPERALDFLPLPDVLIQLNWRSEGRQVTLIAYSDHGIAALRCWQQEGSAL